MPQTRAPDDHLTLPVMEVHRAKPVFGGPESRERALELGAFLVTLPEGTDTAPGLRLCRNFYKPAASPDDRYRGHRSHGHTESKLGYSDRPDQVEQLQLESAHWDKYLPQEVTSLLRQMESLTLDILYEVLVGAGVREEHLETITGGMRQGTGWCHSTINHYRSLLADRHGIVDHTDSGFITLLHADQPGLEILHEGRWRPVEVQDSHFIVNLGDALQILTENLPRPITAVVHRVPESPPRSAGEDRSSFTVFMGPRYDMMLYQYGADGSLGEYQSFREFSVEKARKLGYEFHPRL